MQSPSEPIIRGVDWEMQITVKDEDGVAKDMTVSGRSILLRFRLRGTTTVAFERGTETATDFTKITWASGIGKWVVFSDDTDFTSTSGDIRYDVDAYYIDTSLSPTERRFLGTAMWAVQDPELGGFS